MPSYPGEYQHPAPRGVLLCYCWSRQDNSHYSSKSGAYEPLYTRAGELKQRILEVSRHLQVIHDDSWSQRPNILQDSMTFHDLPWRTYQLPVSSMTFSWLLWPVPTVTSIQVFIIHVGGADHWQLLDHYQLLHRWFLPQQSTFLPIFPATPHSYQILSLGPSLIPSYTGELQLPATNSNLY